MVKLSKEAREAIRADAQENAVGAGVGDTLRLLDDYAAIEAELAKLKGEYEWVASINTALDESNQSAWAENAKLRAELERRVVPDGWRTHSVNFARAERCPQTIETLQAAWDRDQELIDDQRAEIASLKQTVNQLRQKLSAPKADPIKVQLLEALKFAVREQSGDLPTKEPSAWLLNARKVLAETTSND